MARLRDIPHVLKTVGPWSFAKRVYNQTYEDNLLVWAAALAYSWLFALFPFLIFCLSLVPLMPDSLKPSEQTILMTIEDVLVTGESMSDAALDVAQEVVSPEEEVNDPRANAPGDEPATLPATGPAAGDAIPQPPTARDLEAVPPVDDPLGEPLRDPALEDADPRPAVDPDAPPVAPREPRQPAVISQTISSLVSDLINRPPAGLLTISLLIALFTASGGMAMTMAGLDKCYDVAPEKMRPLWKARPMAMLLTIVIAILLMLTLAVLPIGGAVISYLSRQNVGNIDLTWISGATRLFRWIMGLTMMLAALAIAYRFGPSVRTRLHLVSPGSLFAITMWILTAYAFRLYLDLFGAADSYARTYGAVAGVALMMLVFYVDALFLLIGAEINAEIDFIRLGIRSGDLPEEREVAPIPTYELDEEDRELKAELENRRSVDEKPRDDEPSIAELEAARANAEA